MPGRLDDDAVAVVDLVLDDLRGEAMEGAGAGPEALVEIADLNRAVAHGVAFARQREAGFARLVRAAALEDRWVVHEQRGAPVVDGDDAPPLPDHVGGEAYALVRMGGECVQQVLAACGVVWRGVFGRQAQHERGCDDRSNHGFLLVLGGGLAFWAAGGGRRSLSPLK